MNIREQVAEIEEQAVVLDPSAFDEAIIGTVEKFGSSVVVAYDKDKIIEILMRDMSADEALEYFDYNILGAWMGGYTPCFVTSVTRLSNDPSKDGS